MAVEKAGSSSTPASPAPKAPDSQIAEALLASPAFLHRFGLFLEVSGPTETLPTRPVVGISRQVLLDGVSLTLDLTTSPGSAADLSASPVLLRRCGASAHPQVTLR